MSQFRSISLALLLIWLSPCQADSLSEGRLKSAYVLNFARFVQWPANTVLVDHKLTLCVVGNRVLNGALNELDGRKAGDHELRVVEYETEDTSLGRCNILFIGESERNRSASIIKTLGDTPTLTISDIDDFAENGGVIGLRYRNDKIVFEVNLTSAQQTGLHLPGQLLNLAAYVFGK